MSQEFIDYLQNLINENKFINGEITFGKLNNNFLITILIKKVITNLKTLLIKNIKILPITKKFINTMITY